MTALLHDFDYEIHPTLDKHPQDGAPILREEGYPGGGDRGGALARRAPGDAARHAAQEDALRLRRAVRASCTRAGSCARPASTGSSRSRCAKKLKQPSFAAGVHRDEVYAGAELLGLELDEHIANVSRRCSRSPASSACARRPTPRSAVRSSDPSDLGTGAGPESSLARPVAARYRRFERPTTRDGRRDRRPRTSTWSICGPAAVQRVSGGAGRAAPGSSSTARA